MPAISQSSSFGRPLFKFRLISSTNDFARRLVSFNFPEGSAVLAYEQVAGRGTKGRKWHSALGKGLYVSFILRPLPSSLNLLPLTIGLAAAEAIQKLSRIEPRLKWPNDLVYQGKKLGGILCEAQTSGHSSAWVVAGIGVNLNHRLADFSPEISALATSLFLVTGKTWKADDLFRLLGSSLRFWYNKLQKGQDNLIIERYQKRSSIAPGQGLLVGSSEGPVAGKFQGIDEEGRLRLKTGSVSRAFQASEIIKVLPYSDSRSKKC
jgi:BirA family biotin operon repressor/biotin-[acetyl-CoA-carboxylase] ligase